MNRITLLLLCLMGLPFAGCSSGPEPAGPKALLSEQVMQRRLRELVVAMAGAIEDAGKQIATESEDLAVKRLSVLYRMRATNAANRTLREANPVSGFLDLWTLCIQFDSYLQTGQGNDLFGPQQPIAVASIAEIRSLLDRFAREVFPEGTYAQARKDVLKFAADHAIEGRFSRLSLQPSEVPEEQLNYFSWLPSLSLDLFGGVGEGISEGAAALDAFGVVADRFTDVVEFLPRQLGWQLELFLYDLEESRPLGDVAAGVQRVGAAAEAIGESGKNLPARVRAELEAALDTVDPKLAEVRATLADLDGASTSLDRLGTTFDGTAASIAAMAQQLDVTLRVFRELYILLDGDPNAPPKPPEQRGHPFNVVEFDSAARSVADMAASLRETLATVQSLVANEKLGGRIAEVQTSTEKTATWVIWMAAAAMAAVLMLFFALRWLFARLQRNGATTG